MGIVEVLVLLRPFSVGALIGTLRAKLRSGSNLCALT